MKYHYKSPIELQTEQQTERKSRPTRNRVTMIVLMDIAILVIIFGVIYFSGVWPTGEKHSGDTVERGDLSFSVTARRESAGAIDFFLNVHNTAGSLREFPAPDDPLQAAHIEVQMNG
ncbi:MAG: hypothetical protein KDK34_23800, partial [Leptospiraceae bacterium]|nr:hypothetical protein [Leptospiraceae bacterium]